MTTGDRPRRPEDLPASPEPGAPGDAPPGGAPPPHNQADQFSKSLLRDALSWASISMPETEVEVVAATQRIDVYAVPDPARAAERPKMGLLGELSVEPSLFEPFHNTPGLPPIRRVLCKQLTWHHELERRARAAARAGKSGDRSEDRSVPEPTVDEADDGVPPIVPFPWLVVICRGRPDTVLEMYGCEEVRPGVYEAVRALRMRVVVLAELPRTRETLLLRLLGGGRVLREALADLAALPVGAWEKSIAAPLLIHFGIAKHPRHGTRTEDKVSAEIRAWFEGYKRQIEDKGRAEGRSEGLAEGRSEGRAEGRSEEAARALMTALRVRGIDVPEADRERILGEKDPERLERWLERAIVAASIREVLDEPS